MSCKHFFFFWCGAPKVKKKLIIQGAYLTKQFIHSPQVPDNNNHNDRQDQSLYPSCGVLTFIPQQMHIQHVHVNAVVVLQVGLSGPRSPQFHLSFNILPRLFIDMVY